MNCLLTALIVLQMIAMCIIILYTTYVRYKHDKKFWKQQEEISEEFLKQLREQPAVRLDEGVAACEQKDTDKE